jgi:hypothetical protein
MELNYKKTDSFCVRDLSVAAFLYSCDQIRLQKVEKDQQNNVVFHFTPFNEALQLTKAYWNLQAPAIQPKRILSSLRDIKDIIFSEK